MGKYNTKFEKYKELKFFNSEKIYIFYNGVFYITFNEDADRMHEIFGFMVKQMGEQYRKCEFPIRYFDRYATALKLKNIEYEIVEMELPQKESRKNIRNTNIGKIEMKCNNPLHLEIFHIILRTDISILTPLEALNLLSEFQRKIRTENEQ